MSVGLGQVRMSTAEYLEENGYIPEASAKEGGWNIPIIGFIYGTETMTREKRLENNKWNIMYVTAYIKAIEDYWIEAYPNISSDPGVLGTLYNQGHNFSTPHGNPQPGPFGEKTEYFYELMEEALE